MTYQTIYSIVLLSFALGLWNAYRHRHLNIEDIFGRAFVFPFAVIGVLILVSGISTCVWNDWHGDRLAAAFALAKGYRLYYPADSGPILGTIYGPMSVIPYLPAVLASSPTIALLIGGSINALLFLIPPWFLFYRKESIYSSWKFLSALACCIAIINSTMSVFAIHADAPSVGFGLLAYICLVVEDTAPSMPYSILSALFATMALWSKQAMAPGMIALPIFLAVRSGSRAALQYVKIALSVAIPLSLGLLFYFGPSEMYLNIVKEPQEHYARLSGHFGEESIYSVWGLLKTLVEMLQFVWPYCAGLVVLWAFTLKQRKHWIIPSGLLLIALLIIPTSIVARLKPGGGLQNSFYTNYFIIIAAFCAMWIVIKNTQNARWLSACAKTFILGITLLNLHNLFSITDELEAIDQINQNAQQRVYEFLKQNPGSLYFPWNTLPPLMAEGKLYHFGDAVLGRESAGLTVTPEHFMAHIPAHAVGIALHHGYTPDATMIKRLPQFSIQVKLKDLRGFEVHLLPEAVQKFHLAE